MSKFNPQKIRKDFPVLNQKVYNCKRRPKKFYQNQNY